MTLERSPPTDYYDRWLPTIYVFDVTRRKIVAEMGDSVETREGHLDWSPDGKSLYFSNDRGEILRYDVSTIMPAKS
jgi:Tol biopolymer transport system component